MPKRIELILVWGWWSVGTRKFLHAAVTYVFKVLNLGLLLSDGNDFTDRFTRDRKAIGQWRPFVRPSIHLFPLSHLNRLIQFVCVGLRVT